MLADLFLFVYSLNQFASTQLRKKKREQLKESSSAICVSGMSDLEFID